MMKSSLLAGASAMAFPVLISTDEELSVGIVRVDSHHCAAVVDKVLRSTFYATEEDRVMVQSDGMRAWWFINGREIYRCDLQ